MNYRSVTKLPKLMGDIVDVIASPEKSLALFASADPTALATCLKNSSDLCEWHYPEENVAITTNPIGAAVLHNNISAFERLLELGLHLVEDETYGGVAFPLSELVKEAAALNGQFMDIWKKYPMLGKVAKAAVDPKLRQAVQKILAGGLSRGVSPAMVKNFAKKAIGGASSKRVLPRRGLNAQWLRDPSRT